MCCRLRKVRRAFTESDPATFLTILAVRYFKGRLITVGEEGLVLVGKISIIWNCRVRQCKKAIHNRI